MTPILLQPKGETMRLSKQHKRKQLQEIGISQGDVQQMLHVLRGQLESVSYFKTRHKIDAAEMTTQTLTTEHLFQIRKEFEEVTASKPVVSILLYAKNEDGKYRNNSVETEWQGYLRARTERVTEILALKEQLAESRKDYKHMVTNYQTLIIDLAPHLAPDQIHMVGGRTGNWFYAMEDGKYLVRHDPRDSEAGLWENTKPTSPNS